MEDQGEERLISGFLSYTTRWIIVSFDVLMKLGIGLDFRRKDMLLVWDMEILLRH